jgi:hypothetical protein
VNGAEDKINTTGEYLVITPQEGERGRWLEYTSKSAWSGCQGFVQPAIITVGTEPIPVVAKQFFRYCVDDRGDSFTQDPSKEAEDSYQTFCRLREWGLRVPEWFALGLSPEGQQVLLMTDLTNEGEYEVFDEKWISRNVKVEYELDGQRVGAPMKEVIEGLANKEEVELGFLHTSMLQGAYGFSFGILSMGIEHMLVRDPKSNTARLVVTDVGEYWRNPSKYREVADEEVELAFPWEQAEQVFRQILHNFHPDADASVVLQRLRSSNKQKIEFQELLYKCAVGKCLSEHVGGWAGDNDYAKKRFVKTDFDEHFLRIKLRLLRLGQAFEEITGSQLLATAHSDFEKFCLGQNDGDFALAWDFAVAAVLDAKLLQMINLRRDVALGIVPKTGQASVAFNASGMPQMGFLDSYYESNGESTMAKVWGKSLDWNRSFVMDVEFDWESAYSASTCGGSGSLVPLFRPEQIRALCIRETGTEIDESTRRLFEQEEEVEEFDPALVVASYRYGNLYFSYKEDVIYTRTLESKELKASAQKVFPDLEILAS